MKFKSEKNTVTYTPFYGFNKLSIKEKMARGQLLEITGGGRIIND